MLCIGVLSTIASLSSCQKRVDAKAEWRIDNERRFEAYAQKSNFQKVTVDGLTPFIYMRWIERGKGQTYPIYTSRVLVHYECYLLTGSQSLQDGNFDQERSKLLVLDRGKQGQTIQGIQIALQNMVVGDETEAIIPWYLAYGAKGKNNIQPYSSLRFRIRLDAIIPEGDR